MTSHLALHGIRDGVPYQGEMIVGTEQSCSVDGTASNGYEASSA